MDGDLDSVVASQFDYAPDSGQMQDIMRELELQDVAEFLKDAASRESSGDMTNAVGLNSSPVGGGRTPAIEDSSQRKTSAGSINMNDAEMCPILVGLPQSDEPPSPPCPLSPIDKYIKLCSTSDGAILGERRRLVADPLSSIDKRKTLPSTSAGVTDGADRMQHHTAERSRQASVAQAPMQQEMSGHAVQQPAFVPNLRQSRGSSVGHRPSAAPHGYNIPYETTCQDHIRPPTRHALQLLLTHRRGNGPGGSRTAKLVHVTLRGALFRFATPTHHQEPLPQQWAEGFVHPHQAMGGMVEMSQEVTRRHSTPQHAIQGDLNRLYPDASLQPIQHLPQQWAEGFVHAHQAMGGMVEMSQEVNRRHSTPLRAIQGDLNRLYPDASPQPPQHLPQQWAEGFVHPHQAMGGMVEMTTAVNGRETMHWRAIRGSLNKVNQTPRARMKTIRKITSTEWANKIVQSIVNPQPVPQQERLGTLRMPSQAPEYTIADSPSPQLEMPSGSSCHTSLTPTSRLPLLCHSMTPSEGTVTTGGMEETDETHPYECAECHRRFTTKSALVNHRKSHARFRQWRAMKDAEIEESQYLLEMPSLSPEYTIAESPSPQQEEVPSGSSRHPPPASLFFGNTRRVLRRRGFYAEGSYEPNGPFPFPPGCYSIRTYPCPVCGFPKHLNVIRLQFHIFSPNFSPVIFSHYFGH